MILNKLRKKKQLVVLAIMLMSAFYLQPEGIQLKFCLGDDGHFDITADTESGHRDIHVDNKLESDPDAHHNNCLDFILTSNGMVSRRPDTGFFTSSQSMSRLGAFPALMVSNVSEEQSDGRFNYYGFCPERCNCIPAFISSVILLI